MRLLIPLKYKVLFPAIVGVVGTGLLYRALTLKGLEAERSFYGFEAVQSTGESARFEIETWVKSRLAELERLTEAFQPGRPDRLFRNASSDFNADVLNITFYRAKEKNEYSIEFATNLALLEKNGLPSNTPFLTNQARPVPVRELAQSQNTVLLNRSFTLEDGTAVGVHSFVLYGKNLNGNPRNTIVVADVLAESLSAMLGRSKISQTFLVTAEGTLIAHADAALLAEYNGEPFPGFPLSKLPSNWKEGARVRWESKEKQWFALVAPTAMPGVFLASKLEKTALSKTLAVAEKNFFIAVWAVLGACLLLTLWVAGGLVRNIRKTAQAAEHLLQGEIEKAPHIRSWDEFRYVREIFDRLAPGLKAKMKSEFDRGQHDASLATVQTLRAAMANPAAVSFGAWEVITHRAAATSHHQDFWDFYQVGGRRQVIVGKSNVDGVTGTMVAIIVRTTLDNLRKLNTQFSPGRPLTLAETLDTVNAAIFNAFKGRAGLLATAVEMDIDNGNVTSINAGGPAPFRWKLDGQSLVLDDKSLILENPLLGAAATSNFRATTAALLPGERLFLHTETTRSKNGEDAARSILLQTVFSQGSKSLAELKTQLMNAVAGRAFESQLLFVAFNRPLKQATGPTQMKAAA